MRVYLSNTDKFVIIDNEDYELVKNYSWRLSSRGYAERGVRRSGVYKKIFMHRVIAKTPAELFTDHINEDKLDNRKSNLRWATKSINGNNRTQKNNKSGYRGVWFNKKRGEYVAFICVNKQRKHLGRFNNYDDAVRVRRQAEQEAASVKWTK